jgi:hypothetical protein
LEPKPKLEVFSFKNQTIIGMEVPFFSGIGIRIV